MEKKICIKKENIRPLLNKLTESYEVYIPVRDKETGIIDFMNLNSLKDNERLSINFNEKTKKSPKSLLFPLTEELFGFEYIKDIERPDITEIRLTANLDSSDLNNQDSNNKNLDNRNAGKQKKIIFGLKPCDTLGIKSFDMVFNEEGKEDAYYSEKRVDTVLVSIGCNTIFPDCFCLSVGGNPFNFDYSDIGLIDLGDCLVVQKNSENETVKKLIEEFKDFFEEKDFDETGINSINDVISASNSSQHKSLEKMGLKKIDKAQIEKIMEDNFSKEDVWKEISEKCISCGACTYVCPTCVCFNISDEIKNLTGERYRCWDFCTNYYYTLEASGHNPRSEIFQRYRNKINCKFNYFHKRKKALYCVGCGRCVDVCPVGMDIREILKKVIVKIL